MEIEERKVSKAEEAALRRYVKLGDVAKAKFHSEGYDYGQILPLGPEYLTLVREKVHPLIIKILAPYMCALRMYRFNVGQSIEGPYLSLDVAGDSGEELRVTVRPTRADYKTNRYGVWFLGSSDYEYMPRIAGSLMASPPAKDLHYSLKALELYGEDDDIDCVHEGIWIGRSNGDVRSPIHDVWRLGGSQVVITLPTKLESSNMISLAYAVDADFGEHKRTVIAGDDHTTALLDRLEMYDPDNVGVYGEVVEDDAVIIIEQAPRDEEVAPAHVTTQSQVCEPLLRRWAEDDDRLGHVAYSLLAKKGVWNVFQIIQAPDDPYVIFRLADAQTRIYYVKVKK